jgi:predicted AAA+ superfamily ATPase
MVTPHLYPRFARARLLEALSDTPAVLIHGPRQSGKTTLARQIGDELGYAYFSFDDAVILEAARVDPVGFVDDLPEKAVLDEVQRAPWLFTTLKASIDRRRLPGRFILTGSANVLLVPSVSDSLAGRIEIIRLHPLAQSEIAGSESRFLDVLFTGSFKISNSARLGADLIDRIVSGGYPAALARSAPRRRQTWYRDYIETLVQRDIRDLAKITSLDVLPRLAELAAGQTAHLLNIADLAAPFMLSRPTITEYLGLLERLFLVERLPSWHSNRLSRLIKSPKLHFTDTGLAAALLGTDATALREDRALLGQLVETFVYQELRRQASWLEESFGFYHYRDKDGAEVDIVIERGTKVAGVEVKVGATAVSSDFRGLRKLQTSTGNRFACGVLLYDGETTAGFGEGMYAVPTRALWEMI